MTKETLISYKIEALTPIHIGNGKKYPPLEHYCKDRKLVRIDFYRMCEDNDLVNKMDLIIKAMMERKRVFDVAPELAQRNSLYEVDNLGVQENAEVKEFIKTRGKPYIPGSSVKGAILTGVLIKQIKEGEISIDYQAFTQKNRGGDIVRDLTRRLGGGQSDRWLRVTDSSCLETSRDLAAGKVSVLPSGPPIYMEFLKPGAVATLEIEQLSDIGIENVLELADEFYREVLKKENQWLQKYGFEPLDFCDEGYVLRIGGGSSKLATSVCILTENVLKNLSNEPALRQPKTRKVVDSLRKTMGWAILRRN